VGLCSSGQNCCFGCKIHNKNHDGALMYGNAIGRSDREKNDPTKSSIVSSITFETGDRKMKWLNGRVLAGKGKKIDNEVRIDYNDYH
jgi:hypothetical protein